MSVSVSIVIMSNWLPYNPPNSKHRIGFRDSCRSLCNVSKRCGSVHQLSFVSIKGSSMYVPNMVLSVCEGEGKKLVHERVGEASLVEQKLPPWGGLALSKKPVLEPDVAIRTEPALKKEKKKAVLDASRVNFLEEIDVDTLSKRLLVLSRTNKTRSALELFSSMKLSGLLPTLHSCNSLLSCLLRNGFLDNALRVFEFMKRKKLTTGHTCSLILKAVSDTQGCDSAIRMFREMERESEVRGGFDTIVYNTVISLCGKVNNWRETERLWRDIKENGHTGTRITYCLLVSIFVRCGEHELALDAYNEMIENKFEPGKDTMQAIIGVCSKEGKWDLALNIFQNMLDSGLKPNTITFNALINSLGKAAEVEQAFRVFKIMRSMDYSPDTYTWKALLGALYRANRHGHAIKLFESIVRDQRSPLNLHLYDVALMSCSKIGLWDKSLQILWQLETSGSSVSTSSYNLVISACEMARKPEVALQVYEHMVHQKCTPDTFTHLSLIRCLIWGSLWEEVDEILNKGEPDASLYNAAIQGMSLRRKTETAKKLYVKMRKIGLQPDGKTRALMLQNLRVHTKKKQPPRHRASRRSKFSSNRRY